MKIERLNITGFRNYDEAEIIFGPKINIFYGFNGQGKTNLLEAIYVLGLTKSHRSFIDNNLINQDKEFAKIKGIINDNKIKTKYEIDLTMNKKVLKIDNDQIKKLSDYISKINIIIFYPEDLNLIKGSPNERRKFLNTELSQLYSNYIDILNDYYKLLKTRNDCLKKLNKKEKIDMNYFEILTQYLINKAILIYRMRNKFIIKINENINIIYQKIFGFENFHLEYKTNCFFSAFKEDVMREILTKKYQEVFDKEVKYCQTLIGPHRDDIEFYLDKINLKNYGSQGQQRLAILALKLSEITIFKNYKKTIPILLLDDVFSELDNVRKNRLLKYIKNNIQTIITTTEITNIDPKILEKAEIFKVKNGKIKKEVSR